MHVYTYASEHTHPQTYARTYLDNCGLIVPALKRVGDACVNHFSDNKLYVCVYIWGIVNKLKNWMFCGV